MLAAVGLSAVLFPYSAMTREQVMSAQQPLPMEDFDLVDLGEDYGQLSVFGHHVSLVFDHGLLELSPEIMEGAELIELADVASFSLFDDPEIPDLPVHLFAGLLEKSDAVINV